MQDILEAHSRNQGGLCGACRGPLIRPRLERVWGGDWSWSNTMAVCIECLPNKRRAKPRRVGIREAYRNWKRLNRKFPGTPLVVSTVGPEHEVYPGETKNI